ncbi:hypothetical protein [Tropicimonas sp. S265A]|uniref:hypothetical protein n=1 Tax=Tropicimonas sp. S265A TaxID=3415134 RepID=UPI003C7D125D
MPLSLDPVVLFRMGERLTLTVIVILVALIVMVGFWRTVQKVEITEGKALGLAGSFMFSTPVLVLLAIVGYAWVSLSNPITLATTTATAETDDTRQASGGVVTSEFIGMGATRAVDTTPYDLTIAQRRVRSLNCLASAAGELTQRQTDDLADTKLVLMGQVWSEDWGDSEAFAIWARDPSGPAPSATAANFFNESHVIC